MIALGVKDANSIATQSHDRNWREAAKAAFGPKRTSSKQGHPIFFSAFGIKVP
jgi:hypothetical protein